MLSPGEQKTQRKPQRFSSLLPDSQELLEIRAKKKVRIHNLSYPRLTLSINKYLNSNLHSLFTLQLLIAGTEQFNQKPKKGIQFLQEKGLLSDPMDNSQVAQWLRENHRLDKKMIGEYISDRKNMDLLDSFVR